MSAQSVIFHVRSEAGKRRQENQDRCLARELHGGGFVLALADGMGGAAGGAFAAETAIRILDSRIDDVFERGRSLTGMLLEAGDEIKELSSSSASLRGMGTTLTVVAARNGWASWAHSGDTRLHLLSGGRLTRIGKDHRFLQDLIDSGDIAPEELPNHPLRNVLDQCLGHPGLKPDSGSFVLQAGDLVVLTTDGIHDHVSMEMMRDLFVNVIDLSDMAERLIEQAVAAGSGDDLSVVLCRVAIS